MEMSIASLLTLKGMLSLLAVLALVCSIIYVAPGIAQQFTSIPYGADGLQPVSIPGLDGLQGFVAGENQISLATYMVSQDGDQLYFEVVGMAVAGPSSPQSTVYTFNKPLMGVLDRSQNTAQIDMSGLAASVGTAGTIDKASLFDALRTDANVFIINLDATFAGTDGDQALFDVDSVSFIAPDGHQDLFALQQPMRLVIDTVTYRMSFPVFPQLAD